MTDLNNQPPMADSDSSRDIIDRNVGGEYKYGFVTDIDTEVIRRGLDEDIVRLISAKKGEPEWLLEFRLKAFRHWKTLSPPHWPISIFLKSIFRR